MYDEFESDSRCAAAAIAATEFSFTSAKEADQFLRDLPPVYSKSITSITLDVHAHVCKLERNVLDLVPAQLYSRLGFHRLGLAPYPQLRFRLPRRKKRPGRFLLAHPQIQCIIVDFHKVQDPSWRVNLCVWANLRTPRHVNVKMRGTERSGEVVLWDIGRPLDAMNALERASLMWPAYASRDLISTRCLLSLWASLAVTVWFLMVRP